ncbi:hypothetical protein, partial [Adlercreutzia equolifaciens]|uniref:hypothetical protein n=1 Tax=Adlercreutzia equolifaciens TaxID=446660 RepID=UPI003AB75291
DGDWPMVISATSDNTAFGSFVWGHSLSNSIMAISAKWSFRGTYKLACIQRRTYIVSVMAF